MPVLVTGATGFVGSHVVRVLLERGYEVHAGERVPGRADFLKKLSGAENLKIFDMNLFDIDSLQNAISGCEDVIHCAAALHISAKDVQKEVVDPSVIGVENICSVMKGVKRVVHTSSIAAIRSTAYSNDEVFSRKDWCNDATLENNPYGLAKSLAEKNMRSWAKKDSVRLVTIHPSVVFGPVLDKRHVEGSMSYLKHFVNGPPFVLDMEINFCDVRDVAIAHVNALEMGDDGGRHIIHTKKMDMREIGLMLRKEFGGKWAVRRLPKLLAYFLAIFHPKLSIKTIRNSVGKRVSYDVEDAFEVLDVDMTPGKESIIDGITSIQAQG